MIEAVTGLLSRRIEPAEGRSDPPAAQHDDTGGGGVSLRRLLAVARLTPAQAVLLVADVLDQIACGHGRYPVRLRDDDVRVTDTGYLTIECTGPVMSRDPMNEAVTRLLRDVAANCRGSALSDRLDESISDSTDLDGLVHAVGGAIAPDVDAGEERRRRHQLADLVAATTGRLRSDGKTAAEPPTVQSPPPPVVSGTTLAPHGWFPPVRNPWHRRSRRPSRRNGVLGLIALLVLVAALWAAPRMWSELRRGWDAVLDPVNSSEQNQIRPVSPPPEPADAPAEPAPGSGTPVPRPVDVAAPSSAGPITLVTATLASGQCVPGQACDVRVDVHLDPAATVGTVTWRLNIYDRCSGEARTSDDVSLPVPPGEHQVYGIVRTDLPPGAAHAVAAITSAPATAASEPLLVPAENAHC
ncbi:hypothetical protein ACFTWF_16000 [Rhodococcus sp. NPDC056960]|uniref:hypothetical protein n=1 Tax=Rhodococcus sp. NPDC056960 TaxID=3345982 RepID=UPI00363754EE